MMNARSLHRIFKAEMASQMARKRRSWLLAACLLATASTSIALSSGDFVYYVSSGNVIIIHYSGSGGSVVIPSLIDGKPVTEFQRIFGGHAGLTSITIPDSVTLIDSYAFSNCTNLTSVSIGNGVTSIKYSAFRDCTGLTSIMIPNSVTSIQGEGRAFEGCRNLSEFIVGLSNPSYSSLDGVLFNKNQNGLLRYPQSKAGASYTIPSSVKTIGYDAFKYCFNLSNLVIPDSVTYVGSEAFSGCSYLSSLVIPDSVTSLGNEAFSGCSSLTNISIGTGVNFIGDYVFSSCTSLASITIPDNVASLGYFVFRFCSSLTNVEIGTGVNSIGYWAFAGCSSLTAITVAAGNSRYSSSGGVLFYNYQKTLVEYPSAISGNYAIPDSVTSIGNGAFGGCAGLTGVAIPDSVTTIGAEAFIGCSSLTNITIPDSVTLIARSAFNECTGLTSVMIGTGVTTILDWAFSNCSSLYSVIFAGNAPLSFGSYIFYDVSNQFSIYFYEGATGFTSPTWKGYPCEVLEPSSGFDAWAAACPAGQRNPSDAPDSDGIPNLMKYAAGLEPGTTHTTADLFTSAMSNSLLVLTYHKDPAATDVSLYPVTAVSLTNVVSHWSANGIATFATGETDTEGRVVWRAVLPCDNSCGFLRLTAYNGQSGELRSALIGTWNFSPDDNPSGIYFINTYRDDGTMSSEEHIPGEPETTSHGTFTVSGNHLHLDWGGGDTYTHIISIDGDTLSGTDMEGDAFSGIRL